MAQKEVGKSWFKQTFTDSSGNSYNAVTMVRDVVDTDFQKVFAVEFLQQLMESDGKDLPVKNLKKIMFIVMTILSMANRENKITATVNEFAEALGMTPRSVKRYLSSFKKLDLIQNAGHGRWLLNNDVFTQLPAGERKSLVIEYRSVKSQNETRETQRKLFTKAEADQEPATAAAVNA